MNSTENHSDANGITPRVETSAGAKILLAVIGIIALGLLLLAVEGVLTLANIGPSGKLFLKKDVGGELYYQQNRDISEFFFPAWATKPPGFESFKVKKLSDSYRILATGASTTLGDPFGPQVAFPNLMTKILGDVTPERTLEIANCAIIAISSLDVLMLHHDALSYEPDAILIYCGHNEAYGADGIDTPVQNSFSSRSAARFWLKFRNLRLVRLVRNAIGTARPKAGSAADKEGFGMWLMKDRLVSAECEKHERMLSYYEDNIREMLESARERGVDVILCTLISNLRDQSPLGSVHSSSLTAADEREWKRSFNVGRTSMATENWSKAAEAFRSCIALDSEYAESYFRLGRCLDALGDSTAALNEYRFARDFDAVHFRACSAENEILRAIASDWDTGNKHELVLIDLEQKLYEQFPNGPGRQIFTEHVHPFVSGHFWIAEQIVEALAESQIAADFGQWHLDRIRSQEKYLDEIGMTSMDQAVGLILTDKFKLAKWPFTNCYDNINSRSVLQGLINELTDNSNPHEQLLLNAVHKDRTGSLFDFGQRHYNLFASYKGQRLGEEALRELEITRQYWWPSAFLETDYAQILVGLKRFDEAALYLETARQIDPDYAPIHFVAGAIHHYRGDLDSAFEEFQAYLILDPNGSYASSATQALELVSRQRRNSR